MTAPLPAFIPDEIFAPPAPIPEPPAPPPKAIAPRKKPGPKPGPAPGPKKAKARVGDGRVLPKPVLMVLIDRVEAAIAAGVIDLHADAGGRCETVEITTGELAVLLNVLVPEDYEQE